LNIAATPRPNIERPVGSDELYKRLSVEVRGHDPAVLESYEKFVRLVSTELDIQLVNV
jgi:small subunit ribosomal protein S10